MYVLRLSSPPSHSLSFPSLPFRTSAVHIENRRGRFLCRVGSAIYSFLGGGGALFWRKGAGNKGTTG